MNQQHSETEEEVKARIEKEAEEKFPNTKNDSDTLRLIAFGKRQGYITAATKYEAELTALREKTVEIAGSAWDQSRKATKDNGSSSNIMWRSARTAHLDALRSEINSSSNKV